MLACACIINGICLIIYGMRLSKVERKLYDQEKKRENNIPAENVSELEVAVYALEGIKRERLMEELKKGNLFEEKDGVTMITRLSGGIFLPEDEGGEEND